MEKWIPPKSKGTSNKSTGRKSPLHFRPSIDPTKFVRKQTKSKTCMTSSKVPLTAHRSSYKTFQNPDFRDYMEDIGVIVNSFSKDTNKSWYCIFDGHGGDATSKLCSEIFPETFSNFLKDYPLNIETAFKQCFKRLDIESKKNQYQGTGSTATVVYIVGKVLYCANVGDSSCVIVTKTGAKKISYDDKCTDQAEVKRIIASGGNVFDNRLDGELAISRAIGDHDLKGKGLISEPHVYKGIICDDDRFCIIASDGIWDVIDEMDVFKMCDGEYNHEVISSKLLNEAIERGSEDNISIIVVSLK